MTNSYYKYYLLLFLLSSVLTFPLLAQADKSSPAIPDQNIKNTTPLSAAKKMIAKSGSKLPRIPKPFPQNKKPSAIKFSRPIGTVIGFSSSPGPKNRNFFLE